MVDEEAGVGAATNGARAAVPGAGAGDEAGAIGPATPGNGGGTAIGPVPPDEGGGTAIESATAGDDEAADRWSGPTTAGTDAAAEANGHGARGAAPKKRPAEVVIGALLSGGGVRPSRSAARNGDTRGRDEEEAITAVVEVVEAAGRVAAAAEEAAAAAHVRAAEDMT
nr:uncharacterized protein LOC127329167 [Lolium perenne]